MMLMSLVFGVTEWLVEAVAVLPCLDDGDARGRHFPRWRRRQILHEDLPGENPTPVFLVGDDGVFGCHMLVGDVAFG